MNDLLRRVRRRVRRILAGPQERERLRLAALPRYQETTTDLLGYSLRLPDAASFLASWDEIFNREIYDFKSVNGIPRILDCGANVGVSCLYFLQRFPKARITAFEPDPKIFRYLQENLSRPGVPAVDLVAKGVWSCETFLRFQSEGADGGRFGSVGDSNVIEVPTVRLRNYLDEAIDFLKIDIEGAETEVVSDIADRLSNVRNIFVEYHSFAEQPQTLSRLLEILVAAGFRFHLHPMSSARKPFIEVKSHLGMDLQVNIFGYRA